MGMPKNIVFFSVDHNFRLNILDLYYIRSLYEKVTHNFCVLMLGFGRVVVSLICNLLKVYGLILFRLLG